MTDIQIESGIPVPAKPAGRFANFPFSKMKVGDSFVVELGQRKSWAFIFAAIQYAQNKYSIQLTTRLEQDGKRRVWRTA